MLKIEGLSKKYDGAESYSLQDVSIELKAGEIVGLIGKNGAGKTTLMKMIGKQIFPSEGSIRYKGEDIFSQTNQLRDVGLMIDPVFYPQLTAFENIKFYLEVNQLGQYEDNIEDLLKLVGLWEKRNNKPTSYSFGMKQRLALAICLVNEPSLAILDEPFVGLDPLGVQDLIQALKAWTDERHMTILISSHQLAELEQICDRYLFIEDGKLAESFDREDTGKILIKIEKPIRTKELALIDPSVTVEGLTVIIDNQGSFLNQVLNYLTSHNVITSIEQADNKLQQAFKREVI